MMCTFCGDPAQSLAVLPSGNYLLCEDKALTWATILRGF